ncbi:MAG: hypothetical protein M3451_13130, partial [Chloroflexota bacterium]|nr:hypothetical protein [Chloroflexota bacterium]
MWEPRDTGGVTIVNVTDPLDPPRHQGDLSAARRLEVPAGLEHPPYAASIASGSRTIRPVR